MLFHKEKSCKFTYPPKPHKVDPISLNRSSIPGGILRENPTQPKGQNEFKILWGRNSIHPQALKVDNLYPNRIDSSSFTTGHTVERNRSIVRNRSEIVKWKTSLKVYNPKTLQSSFCTPWVNWKTSWSLRADKRKSSPSYDMISDAKRKQYVTSLRKEFHTQKNTQNWVVNPIELILLRVLRGHKEKQIYSQKSQWDSEMEDICEGV